MTFKNIPVKLYYLCMYTNNGHVCVFLLQNEIYLIYFKARYLYLEKKCNEQCGYFWAIIPLLKTYLAFEGLAKTKNSLKCTFVSKMFSPLCNIITIVLLPFDFASQNVAKKFLSLNLFWITEKARLLAFVS